MKKISLLLLAMTLFLSACGGYEADVTDNLSDDVKIEKDETDVLLASFLSGEIPAIYAEGEGDPFYITDLSIDEEDAFSYSVGDKVDLDNDGELELILDGAYGGIYLDARAGQVYVLDEGWGTAGYLSYTVYEDKIWIVHCDTTHAGRYLYDLTLYDGTGNVADSFQLTQEFWETPDEPDGPNTVYTYRGEQITKEQYDALKEQILP
ncbi:MAG: hypothetical protein IJ291_03215 [Lachnospiraceae bacterium]|nr:hypothetical protein [Lachnospiraceae bacterium]